MLGLFNKKPRSFPRESAWTVKQGHFNGKPIFMRRNDSANALAGHTEYRFRVGVAIPLLKPNEDGLPSSEEMDQLNAIEDALQTRMEAGQDSLQVLAITTGGMREFVFCTRAPERARESIEQVRMSSAPHELQSYVEEDPKWELFKQFA